MNKSTTQELIIFDDKHIRTFWDDKDEKWLFCINDIVAALTDSPPGQGLPQENTSVSKALSRKTFVTI